MFLSGCSPHVIWRFIAEIAYVAIVFSFIVYFKYSCYQLAGVVTLIVVNLHWHCSNVATHLASNFDLADIAHVRLVITTLIFPFFIIILYQFEKLLIEKLCLTLAFWCSLPRPLSFTSSSWLFTRSFLILYLSDNNLFLHIIFFVSDLYLFFIIQFFSFIRTSGHFIFRWCYRWRLSGPLLSNCLISSGLYDNSCGCYSCFPVQTLLLSGHRKCLLRRPSFDNFLW